MVLVLNFKCYLFSTRLIIFSRFGSDFTYYKSFVDISKSSPLNNAIKTGLTSVTLNGALSEASTMALMRLYSCFARTINCTSAIIDLMQFCLLWRNQELVPYITQVLIVWPTVFKNCTLQGIGNNGELLLLV